MRCANGLVRDRTKAWEASSPYKVLQLAHVGGRGRPWATGSLE